MAKKKSNGFLSLADWHIGAPSEIGIGKDGITVRDWDKLKRIKGIAGFCKQNKIKTVVIAGDIYHYHNPKSRDRMLVAEMFGILSEHSDVLVIPGNHDYGAGGYALVEGMYDIPGVNVVLEPGIHGARCGMDFMCIPHMPEEGGFLSCFAEMTDVYSGGSLVLVGHVSAYGAISSTDFEMRGAEDIDFGAFKTNKVGIGVLGHIHRHQEMGGANYPVVYPGSLVRLNFGERKESKGWLWVREDYSHEYYPFPDRKFAIYNVHLDEDFEFEIPDNFGRGNLNGGVVRVVVHGSRNELNQMPNEEMLGFLDLEDCQYVSIVRQVDSDRDGRVRNKKLAKMSRGGIDMGLAVREYAKTCASKGGNRKLIMKVGKMIVSGKDISKEIGIEEH